jgi:DNA-binding protein H-NS
MNTVELTKGELTKIILQEVRRLNEQEVMVPAEVEKQKVVAAKEVEARLKQIQTNFQAMNLQQLSILNAALKQVT